jgi:hypothetical protein
MQVPSMFQGESLMRLMLGAVSGTVCNDLYRFAIRCDRP